MRKALIMVTFLFVVFCIGICVTYFYVPSKTKLYGFSYETNSTELDFTEITITDFNALVEKIKSFDNLKTVKFKNDTITKYQKDTLQKLYPNINFVTISYINLYDEEYREDETLIDLSNKIIDGELSSHLEDFTNLEEVILYNTNLPLEEKITLVNKYPNTKFKWNVDINGITYDNDIKNIDLTDCVIEDKNTFIKSLGLFNNLETLDMSNTNFTDEELGALRERYPNTQIDWIVHLKRWNIKTNVTSFSVLIRQFDYEPIVSEDLYVLKYCTKLEALDLGHQKITDISMIPEYLPNLKVLILSDNKITDITPLAKMKKLHYLELFINQITDISPLKECSELVDLNLCYNNLLTDITPLYELKHLERVWLVNVPAREQIEELRNNHPNAQIVNLGPGSTEGGWRHHERYYAMIKMFRNQYTPISEVFTRYDGISNND